MSRKIVVLGGVGAMGKITVKDLSETAPKDAEIVIADYDGMKAKLLADDYVNQGHANFSWAQVDVRNLDQATHALSGATVVINSAPYKLNIAVMELCLRLKCHYVDLGGLFHVTLEQLKLHERFAGIQKLALLGMGAAPGITNILARYAADRLEKVTEIHCRVGSMDASKYFPKPALAVSYTLATILEEFSMPPAVFTKGKMTFVEAMSGDKPHRFPSPIGIRKPMYTIHSEVATLAPSYAPKGVKEVSFKIAFDPEFTDRVRFLRDFGFADKEPRRIGDVSVRPIDVVNFVAMNQPPSKMLGKMKQYEVVRSIVKGTERGKKVTYVVDCHTAGLPQWGLGLDVDTGCPPAIAAQMLVKGEITEVGALPAEKCVPPEIFFKYLKQRKMKVIVTKKSGWKFET